MQILYSLIGSLLIAIIVSGFFYWKANKFAGQLIRFAIKETVNKDVEPIFKCGKLTGVHIIKVVNVTETIQEDIVKIVKPE